VRRRHKEQGLFSSLDEASPTPAPASPEELDEDEIPDPSPSRANVLAMLSIADEEDDLEMAGYYVQRAIAESLLLIVDSLDRNQ
jgi:hypothetical protein